MNEIARPAEAVPVAAPPPLAPVARGLSPLNRRRLSNFRRNRLGFWSFTIFVGLFSLSLFAEFIANDRPLV
ncbi:ABC transporter permease, partial [Methylobacterium sp. W2]|nr:ABC transporter permease [Methylobacterium sp. W2]